MIQQIESVSPEGTEVLLTEAQARDIKHSLPKITEQVAEETDGMTPEEANAVIDSIIESAREQKKLDDEALREKESEWEDAQDRAEIERLDREADRFLAPERDGSMTDTADSQHVEFEVEGEGSEHSPRQAMTLYNFFNLVTVFQELPEPEEVIELIPKDREVEVTQNLEDLTDYFNRFMTLWEERAF